MTRALILLTSLVMVCGCGKREESAAPAAPAPGPHPAAVSRPGPLPASRAPIPPPVRAEPNAAEAADAERVVPPQTKLAEALRQYQAAANDPDQRSTLVTDIAALADDGVSKAGVAQALGRLLQIEPATELKTEILNELGSLGTPAAFEPITSALSPNQPAEVRDAGVEAAQSLLTDLGFLTEDPAAFAVLVRAVDPGWPQEVRTGAISALQDRQDPRAVPVLQRLLNDPDTEVREAATQALEWLQNQ